MARSMLPFSDSLGGEIYSALLEFIDSNRAIPNPHAFWSKILVEQKGYPLSRSGFEYWWMRLQIAGLVEVEPITKAVRVRDVRLEVNSL